jgi:hypothetical protein
LWCRRRVKRCPRFAAGTLDPDVWSAFREISEQFCRADDDRPVLKEDILTAEPNIAARTVFSINEVSTDASGSVAPIGKAAGERVWLIADARGPLMPFAGRRWSDRSPAGRGQMMRWLDTILADIRAALEAR